MVAARATPSPSSEPHPDHDVRGEETCTEHKTESTEKFGNSYALVRKRSAKGMFLCSAFVVTFSHVKI